ncbi:MAG: hypothetical protein LBS67_05885 [Clostridiales Family XIII bacterium]|nr:hypothetical protein [Clostridiales Family XIII bacterium]
MIADDSIEKIKRRAARARATIALAVFCVAVVFSSCGALPSSAGGSFMDGVPADDEDYDFSVFFGHAEDPITIARIALRYKAKTGVSVRPIMTAADAADDRSLRRYLNSSDPPAVFALSAEAADSVTASGVGWRFHGRGFAADRRILADLIGAPDAAAPVVDAFVEDLRLADYGEWSEFLNGLSSYIKKGTPAAFTLNDNEYAFAAAKGRYSSRLNGIFAVKGSDPEFFGAELLEAVAATSGIARPEYPSVQVASPPEADAVFPIFDAYIETLNTYTSNVSGRYAPGVRGEDFIDADIYSPEYTASVFADCRAVFTPFDSEDYAGNDGADATQTEHLTLIPVKIPYEKHWLSGYVGATEVNASLRIDTEYSLCVNENAPLETREKAKKFVEWLLADEESSDAVQLCLTEYHAKGAELPLAPEGNTETSSEMSAFGEEIFEDVLAPMTTDPDWQPEEIYAFRDALTAQWRGVS